MSARSRLLRIAGKAGLLLLGLFVVSVLLAAMPGHHPPVQEREAQPALQGGAQGQSSPTAKHGNMPEMDISDEAASEAAAVHDMSGEMAHGSHMAMTALRPQNDSDRQRAEEIVEQLRAGIEKYKDYHVALNDGFRIFLPNVPQQEYHFTNRENAIMEAFTFNPARPTSLLYKKTATGYELVGAMYTMPKRATEDQLNQRVPLSVAVWHQHTNLCMPPVDQLHGADWTKFGLHGSITTESVCDAAGGRFHPVIFGWMVHVYPYESSLDKIFAMHMHMD